MCIYRYLVLQTQAILDARIKEEIHISLSISVYDVARNETARKHRKEQEAKMAEEERIRKEKEMDYLAPFLARIGDPPKLTKPQMEEVTQVCCFLFVCRVSLTLLHDTLHGHANPGLFERSARSLGGDGEHHSKPV